MLRIGIRIVIFILSITVFGAVGYQAYVNSNGKADVKVINQGVPAVPKGTKCPCPAPCPCPDCKCLDK